MMRSKSTASPKAKSPARLKSISPFLLKVDHSTSDFREFARDRSKLVPFFRKLISNLEETRGIPDYILWIINNRDSFSVQVSDVRERRTRSRHPTIFNRDRLAVSGITYPSIERPESCIHCVHKVPVYPLVNTEAIEPECVLADECRLAEFEEELYVRCSMMRSTDPGFLITPMKHVTSMSELTDDELCAMWTVAVKALYALHFGYIKLRTNTMLFPHHLQLYAMTDDKSHSIVRENWNLREKDVWERLTKIRDFRKDHDLQTSSEEDESSILVRREEPSTLVSPSTITSASSSASAVYQDTTYLIPSQPHLFDCNECICCPPGCLPCCTIV